LVEQAESVSAGGKGVVKTARSARGAKPNARGQSRAVLTLPGRNGTRPLEHNGEAAAAARPVIDRSRGGLGGVRIGAPE
jgi:hypothetical protein